MEHKGHFKGKRAVPHAYYLIKNKSNESEGTLKLRIIYSYQKHPLSQLCKLIGRCLTLFLKMVVQYLPCFEMLNMTEIMPWLHMQQGSLKAMEFFEKHIRGSLYEFDIKDMFPSIPKKNLLEALNFLHDRVLEAKGRRLRTTMYFSIHKKFRKLDCMGLHSKFDFWIFTWDQVMSFVEWDLKFNTIFRCNDTLYEQVQGIPIGGPMSSQLASLFCVACECNFLSTIVSRVPFGPPIRFRDNLLLISLYGWSGKEILLWLHRIYGLQFTIEKSGHKLATLETEITWKTDEDKKFFREFSVRWSGSFEKTVERKNMEKKRWISCMSSNAKGMIKSFVPSGLKKCVLYSMSDENIAANVLGFQCQLEENCFPAKWWKGLLQVFWSHVRKGVG